MSARAVGFRNRSCHAIMRSLRRSHRARFESCSRATGQGWYAASASQSEEFEREFLDNRRSVGKGLGLPKKPIAG